jgi:hypothetical protein
MPRTLPLTTPGRFLVFAYVVDDPVGAGCRNQRDDVLLVQFFLRVLGPTIVDGTRETFLPQGGPPLAIDGVCGARTVAAIKTFQMQFNKAVGSPDDQSFLAQDGVVHPLEQGSMFGRRSRHVLTIVRLNTEYTFQFGLDRHKRIDLDPLFPRALFTKLFLPSSQGS